MFGLSWGQIGIIVLVGVFVLGPERIPTAVRMVTDAMHKARSFASGAQTQLRKEIGPELDELRRQVAELQSLKEIQELRDLRDLHPKNLIGKNLFGGELAGDPAAPSLQKTPGPSLQKSAEQRSEAPAPQQSVERNPDHALLTDAGQQSA